MAFENIEWKLIAKDEASKTMDRVNKAQMSLDKSMTSANATRSKSLPLISKSTIAFAALAAGIAKAGQTMFSEAQNFELLEKRFKVLLGSTEAARDRLAELEQFTLSTPFQTDEVAKASAILQTFAGDALATGDGLRFVGDMAAFAQQPIDQIAIHAGRVVDALKSGRPFGESAQRMQELGLISGEARAKLESFQGQTMSATEAIELLQSSVTNVSGTMEEMNNTITGQLSNVEQQFKAKMRQIGQHIFDAFDVKDTLKLFAETINTIDLSGLFSIIDRVVSVFKMMAEDVRTMVNNVRQHIDAEVGQKIVTVLKEVAKIVGTLFVGAWKIAIKTIETVIIIFANVMEKWGDNIIAILKFVGNVVRLFVEAVGHALGVLSSLLTGDFSQAWVNYKEYIKRVWNAIIEITEKGVNFVINGLSKLVPIFDTIKKAAETAGVSFEVSFDRIQFATEDVGNTVGEFDIQVEQMSTNVEDKLANMALGADTAFSSMSGSSTKASDSIEKLKEKALDVGEKYEDAIIKAEESLAKLELAHAETTDGIKSSIVELESKLNDLKNTYENTIAGINRTEAEGVVEQEQKLADLRKQIADERKKLSESKGGSSDTSRLTELESELAKQESAYKKYIETQKGLDAELTEARRRADLTDFERFIEDITARRTEAETKHAEDIARIQEQISEQEAAFQREREVYEAKRAQYIETQEKFKEFHDAYVANIDDMKVITDAAVDQMNKKLEEIVSIVSQIESARRQAGLAGVNVSSFITQQNQQNQPNAGSTTVINNNIDMSGAQISSDQDVDNIIQRIKRELELATLGAQTQ